MPISLTDIGRRLCSFGGLCLHVFLLVVVHWQDALLLMYNLPFKSALRTPTDIYDRENRFRDPSASRDQLLWAPGSTTHASGKAIATAPPTHTSRFLEIVWDVFYAPQRRTVVSRRGLTKVVQNQLKRRRFDELNITTIEKKNTYMYIYIYIYLYTYKCSQDGPISAAGSEVLGHRMVLGAEGDFGSIGIQRRRFMRSIRSNKLWKNQGY